MSCKVTAVCVTHTPFPSFKIQANDDVTNPSMQHYATPYSQCRRHGRHDRNADNTGGTRRSEFYASRTMQWRQKLFEHLVGFQMSTNPKQHYAMPLCNIHNVADMEGTIAMQITPEARGAPSSMDQFATRLTHNGGRRLSSGKVLTIEMIDMLGKLFLIQI